MEDQAWIPINQGLILMMCFSEAFFFASHVWSSPPSPSPWTSLVWKASRLIFSLNNNGRDNLAARSLCAASVVRTVRPISRTCSFHFVLLCRWGKRFQSKNRFFFFLFPEAVSPRVDGRASLCSAFLRYCSEVFSVERCRLFSALTWYSYWAQWEKTSRKYSCRKRPNVSLWGLEVFWNYLAVNYWYKS